MATMVTLQAWRLEKKRDDTNEFKQYTAFTDGQNACFFGYSRIGANWQVASKPGGDAAGRCRSQLRSKARDGYEDVWDGDVTVPVEWALDPKSHIRQIQDMVEAAYRQGTRRVGATDVPDGEPETPLANLLDDCRKVVSKMAASPDDAFVEYSRLVSMREAVTEDMYVVDGYLDTLRAMIGAAQ